MMILAGALVVIVVFVCFFVAHKRILSTCENGACPRPKNGDVSVDESCEEFLKLSNNDSPSSWKI
jgi:hypothetical protein